LFRRRRAIANAGARDTDYAADAASGNSATSARSARDATHRRSSNRHGSTSHRGSTQAAPRAARRAHRSRPHGGAAGAGAQTDPAAAADPGDDHRRTACGCVTVPAAPSLDIITGNQIQASPAQSFGNLLFTTPGATSAGLSPAASRPVLRGLSDFRVRVQENGVGAMDLSDYGQDHGVPIDPLL
jgi:hypothetical protein